MLKRLLLRPMHWLYRHVEQHPVRLFITTLVVVVASIAFAGYSTVQTVNQQRATNQAMCRQMNELRRGLVVAFVDLGYPPEITQRFLPSSSCGDLP